MVFALKRCLLHLCAKLSCEHSLSRRRRMAEDGKCSRWRGRLKLGGLPFLNSPAFVDPSAGLRPRIKWFGVFRDGEGHLVQVWTKPRTQKRVQRIMDEIFRGWIEGLEPMPGGHAFCEREPAFSRGTRDRQGRRCAPLRMRGGASARAVASP